MRLDPSSETSDRHTFLRVVAGILAALATPSAVRDLYGMLRGGFDPLLAVLGACTTPFVALCGWFALRGHLAASRARMRLMVRGGLLLGAIGFAIGFFGPLIWSPDANQGPLLGIFVTGPIGLVIGAALGWLYARMRVRSPEIPSRT
jgi:hypothetical protein